MDIKKLINFNFYFLSKSLKIILVKIKLGFVPNLWQVWIWILSSKFKSGLRIEYLRCLKKQMLGFWWLLRELESLPSYQWCRSLKKLKYFYWLDFTMIRVV